MALPPIDWEAVTFWGAAAQVRQRRVRKVRMGALLFGPSTSWEVLQQRV